MNGELHNSEVNEINKPNTENYKDIKPQSEMTSKEVDDFWNAEFRDAKNSVAEADSISNKNTEDIGRETKAENHRNGMDETQHNNTKEVETNEAGERIYRDDNGEIYRVGDDLSPNKLFEVNGYKYKTDDKGRTVSAEGKLRLRNPEFVRDMDKMDVVGKGDQKETDHRGHSIGHQFEGSGGKENLTPMDKDLNTGAYKAMEDRLADAVKAGADVKLKVEPKYEGDSNRPTEYRATYSIDGEKEVIVFRNDSSEVK